MIFSRKAKVAGAATKVAPSALRAVFGENLRLARDAQGLTQRDLSNLSGVSQRHISKMERGEVSPGLDVVAELARHVGKTPSELLNPPKKPA